jgi:hypothetical protein
VCPEFGQLVASCSEPCIDIFSAGVLAGTDLFPSHYNLAAHELVVLARLTLPLHELAHQFTQDLRGRSMGSLCLGHELGTQLWLQLHGENGFFGHNATSAI